MRLVIAVALAILGATLGSRAGPALAIILAAIGAYLGWKMGAGPRAEVVVVPTSSRSPLEWDTGSLPTYKAAYRDLDIVSGSHRQDALHELWKLGSGATFRAVLTPENNNPYDPNAVRVDIKGLQVGYLSRMTADDYREHMGVQPCAVPVHLVMGGPEGTIGVFPGMSKVDKEERARGGEALREHG